MNIIILVVLYKEKIKDSSTIKSLLEIPMVKDFQLVLWDNSPYKMLAEDFEVLQEEDIDFSYIHSPQNTPLSKIYNRVITNNINAESIFIFDQDSVLEADYFIQVDKAMKDYADIDLFVPYVINKNKIISPANFCLYKISYWESLFLGKLSGKNKFAIASGMAIRLSLFRTTNIRFDENLSFYGADTKFMIDYAKIRDYFFVLNYKMPHSLSPDKDEIIEMKLRRFSSYMEAILYIAKSRSWRTYIICRLEMEARGIYNAIKFRNIGFIKAVKLSNKLND